MNIFMVETIKFITLIYTAICIGDRGQKPWLHCISISMAILDKLINSSKWEEKKKEKKIKYW